MKIDRNFLQGLIEAYRTRASRFPARPEGAQGTSRSDNIDQVSISGMARQVNDMRSKLGEMPAVRSEQVERLKAQIESGSYQVDRAKVAASLISSGAIG